MVTFTTNSADAADIALRQRIEIFLAQRHIPALRQVRVEVRNGTVWLRGQVRTFYEKQLLQQCGRRVAGVIRLVDLVEIEAKPGVPILASIRASKLTLDRHAVPELSRLSAIEITR